MDNGSDWSASALFSPSKARVQQAQAKDWASVDAWLFKRYASKQLPNFERNEETLEALLTLATMNENADEQRSHVDRIEKAALQAYSIRKSTIADDTHHLLLSSLEDREHLDALAEVAVSLNSKDASVSAMATALVDLTSQQFAVEQRVQRAEAQLQDIQSEQEKMKSLLEELNQDAYHPPTDLSEQTAGRIRDTKQLKAKVGEYDERLAGLRLAQPRTARIEDITLQVEDLETHQSRLGELNAELKAYQSLPTDAEAAHAELEVAREELRRFTSERDGLFEGLVDN